MRSLYEAESLRCSRRINIPSTRSHSFSRTVKFIRINKKQYPVLQIPFKIVILSRFIYEAFIFSSVQENHFCFFEGYIIMVQSSQIQPNWDIKLALSNFQMKDYQSVLNPHFLLNKIQKHSHLLSPKKLEDKSR